MKTTVDFLDAVRTKRSLTSDYQLSQVLDCTRASISSYRHGKSFLDEEMACKVAADLGLPAGYVLSCIAAERAKKPEVKAAWERMALSMSAVAATFLIVLALPYIHTGNGLELAGFVGSMAAENSQFVYYVKLLTFLSSFGFAFGIMYLRGFFTIHPRAKLV